MRGLTSLTAKAGVTGRRLGAAAIAVAALGLLGAAPASAEPWHHHHHGYWGGPRVVVTTPPPVVYGYGYGPPAYAYAPPAPVYAPPPVVYSQPGVSLGVTIPLR